MAEGNGENPYKAPPEDVKAAAKHFRPPDEEEIAAAEKQAARLIREAEQAVGARRKSSDFLALFNLGVRLSNEEKELAVSHQHEAHYRQMVNDGYEEGRIGLASSLIIQGRFDEAVEVLKPFDDTVDDSIYEGYAAYCKLLVEARDRSDSDRCDCADVIIDNKPIPSEFVVKRMWIPERERFCWLVQCNICGQKNIVTEMHPAIGDHHDRRMQAIKAAKK